jgi:hypothetical protein
MPGKVPHRATLVRLLAMKATVRFLKLSPEPPCLKVCGEAFASSHVERRDGSSIDLAATGAVGRWVGLAGWSATA